MFILLNGLSAGLLLAAFLALGDGLFGTKTFAVLLDVSYIPGLENLNAIVELLLHLVVSIAVAAGFSWFYPRGQKLAVLKYAGGWMLAFILAFVAFSLLSGNAMSWMAFLLWLLGHILYTAVLMFRLEKRQ
ncbi:hypothetical protein ACAF76_001180 [Brevibacillus sp. TJ4]|uniref:hypothetical protein n=1 Tax=Brevibacillus sp. TJ4 TaxID=3234853 RepID=UPI0037CDD6BC